MTITSIPTKIRYFLELEFNERADQTKAKDMEAYMKGIQPYLGIQQPQRKILEKKFKAEIGNTIKKTITNEEYRDTIVEIWNLPYREYRYTTLFLIEFFSKFIIIDNLDLYKQMIVDGDWWDTTDGIASNYIGKLLRDNPVEMEKILDNWIIDENMWLRRTALLSQLKFKQYTNTNMLSRYIKQTIHENEFFIRKAIGWVLREYSKTDPDYVKEFIAANRKKLSKLSVREGSKYIK